MSETSIVALLAAIALATWLVVDSPPAADAVVGRASWYGEAYRGRTMANGKPFDPDRLTCAARQWPVGSSLLVTHGDKSVVVRVTDFGPSARFPDRIIDLSHAAFEQLANPVVGLIDVTVTPIR